MITVNPNTRQFNIPGADLVFGVEDDSGSVVKEFQVPRYVGNNLDLAACFIRMNYRNGNGEIDTYLVQNVTVEGDTIVFGWELTPKVTMYRGNISFVMCVVGPDTRVKWHTTLGRGQVLEGLEPDSDMVENGTADVVAALIALVEAQTTAVEAEGANQVEVVQSAAQRAQATAVAQIEAKGASTLATIPEDYTAVQNAVLGAANAIRGKVSGEMIRVDDVSPMEHYPVVKVHGKNLIPYPYLQAESNTYDGTLIAQADGGISGSGVPTGNTSLALYSSTPLVKSGAVTFSLSGVYTNMIGVLVLEDSNGETLYNKTAEPSLTVIMSDYPSAAKMQFVVKRKSNDVEMTGVVYPQLEIGSSATDYVPYIDPTTVAVTRCGKNLVSTDTAFWTGVYPLSGGDGALTSVNAAGAANHVYYSAIFPRGRYVASANFTGYVRYLAKLYDSDGRVLTNADVTGFGYYNEYYGGFFFSTATAIITIPSVATYWQFGVIFAAGAELVNTNLTISDLQLELADNATAYEAFDGETQAPIADGTVVGLLAINPTMCIATNTPGVTIACEYSRDTNKVIAGILEKITALGG